MQRMNWRLGESLLAALIVVGLVGLVGVAECRCGSGGCYEDVIVSGAGSTVVNGTYHYGGLYDGNVQFVKDGNAHPASPQIVYSEGQWVFYTGLPAGVYYVNSGDPGGTVPHTGWLVGPDGVADVPTITGGENCDEVSITVSAISGDTTEAGGTATFTLTPSRAPSADVTVPLSSSNTDEGTVPATAVLPSGSTSAVTVTVTGIDDDIDDGDVGYTIVTGDPTSPDADYNDMEDDDVDDVSVTNTDDDDWGWYFDWDSSDTTEAGGTVVVTATIYSEPTGDVVFPLSVSDPTEATISPTSLTFTPENWDTPQTATITGVDDDVDDDWQNYDFVVGPSVSTDEDYDDNGFTDDNFWNEDEDTWGYYFDWPSDTTTEAGGTVVVTAYVYSEPTGDVVFPLSVSDPTEATISPTSLTFTPENWDTPQTATITGVDDDVDDGDQGYTFTVGPSVSTDSNYNEQGFSDSFINTDDDEVGITVIPTSGLTTTETGDTDTFTVVLDTEPTDTVTIDISSDDTTEGTVAPATLTFTTANWATLQTVTVTGVDDLVKDGDIQYTILTAAATGGDYAGVNANDVSVTNNDDDVPGITVSAISGNTAEDGTTATFTVVLDTEPSGTVTIDISSNDTTEGTAAPASLTFTTEDWDTPQTVTVTGVDDEDLDGDIAYTIITAEAACGSSAAVAALGAPAAAGWTTSGCAYAGLDADDVIVINEDDDAVLAPIPTGDAGPDEFLDIVLPLAEGEEPPMIGELPLAAIHAVGDAVGGSCQFLDSYGQPGLAGYIHIYVYSVDVDARPETRELVAHWMAPYNWDTQEYMIAWDTSELAPGYYDLRLYFGSPDTAQTFRIELTPPTVE